MRVRERETDGQPETAEAAGNPTEEDPEPDRAPRQAERLGDVLARERRADPRPLVTCSPNGSDPAQACLLVGEEAGDAHTVAHAALAPASSGACLSQGIPSFSSVMDTIGRNLANSVNHIRNQAKLATVMVISTQVGR